MEKMQQKLKLSWVDKKKRVRLEPRVLVEKPELSNHVVMRIDLN